MTLISYADNLFAPAMRTADLDSVLDDIRSGRHRDMILPIRRAPASAPKELRNALKKKLPVFAGSLFRDGIRNSTNFMEAGVIILDIDHIGDVSERALENDPYEIKGLKDDIEEYSHTDGHICANIYSMFRSPSGDGVKVVFVLSHPLDDQGKYKKLWSALSSQFEEFMGSGIQVDASTKDTARLCFVSHDPDIYINTDAVVDLSKIDLNVDDVAREQSILLLEDDDEQMFETMAKHIEVLHYRNFRNVMSAASRLSRKALSRIYDIILANSRNQLSRESASALTNKKEAYIRSFVAEHDRVPLQHIVDLATASGFEFPKTKRKKMFNYREVYDGVIEWMNERYSLFQMGKCVVTHPQTANRRYCNISENESSVNEDIDATIKLTSRTDFKAYMANKTIKTIDGSGKIVWENYFDIWWNSAKRRETDYFCSYPKKLASRREASTWTGFNVSPERMNIIIEKEKDIDELICQPVLDFIYDIICSKRIESYDFLLDWMADLVQNPTPKKPGIALVIRSTGQGTGKGTFGTILRDLIGNIHSAHLIDTNQVMGDFNSIVENKLLIIFDEAVFAGDKKVGKKLMGIVSEPVIPIRRMYAEAYMADNPARVIIFSNEQHTIHAHIDDRRFYTLNISEAMKDNIEFFQGIRKCMGEGGKESLFNHLMNRNYDKNKMLTRANRNSDMISQIRQSFDSFDIWLMSIIEKQSLWSGDSKRRLQLTSPTEDITMSELYRDYMVGAQTDRYPLSLTSFEERILNMSPQILRPDDKIKYNEQYGKFTIHYTLCSINDLAERHPVHAPKNWRTISSNETIGMK